MGVLGGSPCSKSNKSTRATRIGVLAVLRSRDVQTLPFQTRSTLTAAESAGILPAKMTLAGAALSRLTKSVASLAWLPNGGAASKTKRAISGLFIAFFFFE